jgi:DNA-binding transcriptional ArsR family regulator
MVKYSTKSLDATFGALADSTRRAILERLARGEARVTELAAPFAVSLPAVSKHLRVLENAGLLAREKSGRIQKCRLKAGPMQSATNWLARYQHHWENPAAVRVKRSSSAASKNLPLRPHSNRGRALQTFSLTKTPPALIFNRSVKFDASTLDTTFSALADPTRRAMLACLAFAESSVTELATPFNISLPAFSKHLRVLQQAGLISREKRGRINLCRLVATPMQEAAAWIDRYRLFWEKQLDALAAYLEK